MARILDLGGETEHPSSDGPALLVFRKRLLVNTGTQIRRILWIVGRAVCSFGRSSGSDVCLRILPTTLEKNRQETFRISGLQFNICYTGDAVHIIDPGSSNGTGLKSAGRLAHGTPTEVKSDDEINVADVLTLGVQVRPRRNPIAIAAGIREQIVTAVADPLRLSQLLVGPDKPGSIDFVRIRRVNNCPEEEYILLFGEGLVDSSAEAMIQLPKKVGTGSRGLDLGGDDAGPIARLFWQDGELMLGVLRNDVMRHNDHELRQEEVAPLRPGDVLVADGVTIRVEA